ncbi:hypothetical protein WR25_01224 [Diploscapter pachys]|uniref:SSD domain-containing protein n=1 Tax=Diploscapter pachys TaxID=2018661 RepID=A0A2A2KQ25_9BILA|nr:hypothetical protein WR25_01224 [Diploscapter pachys]
MKCTWAPLEKPWSNVVARYCVFVSRHPWPFIIIPMILCICLSSGVFMHFRIVRGVHYLYSPLNAPWKTEEAVFGENWANDDIHYHPAKDFMRRRGVYMIITAKDKGSILRKEHARQFLKVLEYIGSHNLTSKTGRKYSYKDICLHFQNECFSNSHGRLIADIFARGDEDHFNITYPKWASRYATEKIDVMRLLGNVSFNSNGYVNGASAWMILYQLKKFDENVGELSKEFENAIAAEIENGTLSAPLLNIYYFHSATFDQELAKEQDRIIPKFSITFCVLIVFSVLTTFTVKWVNLPGVKVNQKRRKFLVIDWVLSKPLLGIVGVISTLMAIISATGMLLLCGVTFVDMCTVMPFLSLTIGIDDTFLMLAAWHETNRLHSVEERVETAMRHAAVSISITTLTDCIAFLIGASAPLPAVMFFCYYSSAAIFFIFLYCMTVFVATLSLQGRIEEQERNSLTLRDTINLKEHFLEDVPTKKLLFHMGTHVHVLPEAGNNNDVNFVDVHNPKKEQDHRMWYQRFFEDKFGPFISKPWMTAIFFGLYIVYASFAIYGISNLVIGFDLINVVQKSTSPRAFLTARNSFFPMDSKIVDIAVMKPPNMAARKQREEFFFALQEFETTWCSSGRNSTDFWYFSFQDYMKGLGFDDDIWNAMLDDEESFVSNLGGFLMANDKYSYDVLRDENGTTKAFRLATRVTNVATDSDMYKCATTMRHAINTVTFEI